MPIIYKLVGITSDSNCYTEMVHPEWDESKNEININDVKSLFIKLFN